MKTIAWILLLGLSASLGLAWIGCGEDDAETCGGSIISICVNCSPDCGEAEIIQCGAWPPGDLDSDARCCECVPE